MDDYSAKNKQRGKSGLLKKDGG